MKWLFKVKASNKLMKFVTGLLLIFITLLLFKSVLTKNEPVKANILVVEGWLPYFAIQMTNKEFNNHQYDLIITTGARLHHPNYYEISKNGYFIIYSRFKSDSNNVSDHHLIEILAHNNKQGNNFSHFNFFVNDSLVADIITDKNEYVYKVNWEHSLTDIDSFIVQLDNEKENNNGKRSLYIAGIRIDDTILIPYKNNSIMDIGKLDRTDRIINNYDSYAGKARMELIATGIDSSRIIAVPCKNGTRNRTLTSVLAFKEWLRISKINVKGINIVSQGVHSRRTWMTYNKVLGKSYDIGIIALPENKTEKPEIPNIFKISYEIIGMLYYWIILTFIHT